MKIHADFTGGNIAVKEQNGNEIWLENELRDTPRDWFYWAFCVEDAAGETVTFHFQNNRVGYFGPAVSHDLENWHWLNSVDGENFTYTFGEDENKVYFAHNMLYHPKRFFAFAEKLGLTVTEFCKGRKGSSVPCVKFGSGKKQVILTARHHACEATGNYVLEGVLEELLKNPVPDTTVLCAPFVDYDGVVDGDQGKDRAPHDHNRDYGPEEPAVHPEVAAIRAYAEEHGCTFGFDFHSPWHKGGNNDWVFIVQNCHEKVEKLNRFGELLEAEITPVAMQYTHANDMPFETGWNQGSPNFGGTMTRRPENDLAFSLETTYFGEPDNMVSQEKMVELGRCFARAFRKYVQG